eukprot:3131040-Alexandrium_andersonii.AAC.1
MSLWCYGRLIAPLAENRQPKCRRALNAPLVMYVGLRVNLSSMTGLSMSSHDDPAIRTAAR